MSSGAACLPMAAIVLAAGAGSRMGSLKQLLPFEGQTFVQRAIATALDANFHPVIVVVGAEALAVQAAVASQRVIVVQNSSWSDGMGSSIAAGVKRLQQEETDVAAVAILLADQPLITAGHLKQMRSGFHQNGAAILAAEYGGTLGVPAIFRRNLLSALMSLPPASGARQMFYDSNLKVEGFPLSEGAVDIDTPADLAALHALQI